MAVSLHNVQEAKHRGLKYSEDPEISFRLFQEKYFISNTLLFSDYKSNMWSF